MGKIYDLELILFKGFCNLFKDFLLICFLEQCVLSKRAPLLTSKRLIIDIWHWHLDQFPTTSKNRQVGQYDHTFGAQWSTAECRFFSKVERPSETLVLYVFLKRFFSNFFCRFLNELDWLFSRFFFLFLE